MLEWVLVPLALGAVLVPFLPVRTGPAVAIAAIATSLALAARNVLALVAGRTPEGLGGLLRLDGSGAAILLLVLLLGLLAAVVSSQTEQWPRRFYALLLAFTGTMALAATSDNLGLLWASIEATTLSSALLVGHKRSRQATEAAWKYVILSSTGILFAFVATLVLVLAGRGAGAATLSWTELVAAADRMDPGLVRLALVLSLVGYGTKAGLVPYHFWLPDAHSEAPSPVSALLSGVLLSCALLALDRFARIGRAAGTPLEGLYFALGVLSVVVGGTLVLVARTYKRMLAYSSIENMGLVTVAVGLGTPFALLGAYLHVLAHGVAKALAFFSAGRVHHHLHTVEIAGVEGLLARTPAAGRGLLVGLVALAGLPPFGPFAGKLVVLSAAARGVPWTFFVLLLLGVLLAFVGFLRHASSMLAGPPAEGAPPPAKEPWSVPAALALLVAASVLLCLAGFPLVGTLLAAGGSP